MLITKEKLNEFLTHKNFKASKYHYCSPRNDIGPYDKVEVGFPSKTPEGFFLEYAEDIDNPKQTVYGYVPIEKVVDFINANGGLKENGR